ncbi:MAG: helix-turn-helix domain-containing protein [Bacillota bacterium]|nr:helix-turn-helix domain-containing protein [Bacillota bacterium]
MSIGSRIRSERKRQNLTLKELSDKADISLSYLGDIEKDRNKPSLERLKDIAKALDKNLAFFIDEEGFGEEEDRYIAPDPEIKRLLESLFRVEGFTEILMEFRGFEFWSSREKAEILGLLRAKNEFRESAESAV